MTKKNLIYIGSIFSILGIFLYGFVQISGELREHELTSFDHTVIFFVQRFISSRLTSIMIWITFLGSVKWITIAVIFLTFLLVKLKKYSLGFFLGISSGLGAVFNIVLKTIFQRERPDIQPLITEQGFSFPSGHSMGSFIFYGAAAFVILHFAKKRWVQITGVFSMIMVILLVGLSRVYLGVHFPSDIIGGFSAGGTWLLVCILVFRYYEFRKSLLKNKNIKENEDLS